MALVRRKRSVVSDLRPSSYRVFNSAGDVTNESPDVKYWRGQITDSEGHPGYNSPYSGYDSGGEFFTQANYIDPHRSKGYYSGKWDAPSGDTYTYTGPLAACATSANPLLGISMPVGGMEGQNGTWSVGGNPRWPPSLASSVSAMNAYGATAISRVKPTTSPASLSVALGELYKDGLPHLAGARFWEERSKNIVRNSGSEYLNVAFGWLPLISDIKKTASAIQNWEQLLTQYERDAGKLVRRRYEFPIEKSSKPVEDLGQNATGVFQATRPFSSAFRTSMANVFRRQTTYRKVWFSGAFTYALPRDFNSRNEMRRHAARAEHFLGLEVTPETIYNVTPWSWALDWFTNVGDVLSNVSDFATDGLVMPYGYVMEHTIHTWEYWVPHIEFIHGGGTPPYTVLVTETKQRKKASPFGFGLTWDSFSPRQLAILAALGISRL